jgi:hypothetical protein
MRRTATSLLTACAAALAVAVAVSAASAARTVAQQLSGTVVDDETGAPLQGAMVTLLDVDGEARRGVISDEEGRFSLSPPYPGPWRLNVELLGYDALLSPPVEVAEREWVTVEIRLATRALELEPMVVTARRNIRNPAVQRFYELRDRAQRSGFGQFVAAEDIEDARYRRPSDIFRSMPGIRVVPGAPGRGPGVRMAGGCVPAIFVDGSHVNRMSIHESVDDFITVLDIEGVEVYRGSAGSPGHYHDPAGCGLVLVWTRTELHEPGSGLPWRRILMVAAGMLLFFCAVN